MTRFIKSLKMVKLLLTDYADKVNLDGKLENISKLHRLRYLITYIEQAVEPKELDSEGYNALQIALMHSANYDVVAKLIEMKVRSNVKLEGLLETVCDENGQEMLPAYLMSAIVSLTANVS